ncbi:MAG TPA: protein kinase [Vicinamibacterales bacterium]|nr:protein kinase [Vicinamibacterales bacterium]
MLEPGTQVGRYEIQRRLGRGGMGTVYVAHDPVLGRMVAIKMFAGDLDMADASERFAREARAAAALSHPNVVTVFDFGEFASQPYIVMEYVPGETMANVIRRKTPITIADKLRWMEELCAGAGYAHQMSLVHRDIKPANLMIDRSGRVKILDFGIARMLGIASNTAVMIGTPGYMAPEQITGEPVDHRSDQFSIGVVFYELLAYSEPFPGDTLPMITHRIVHEEPTPLEQLVPDVNPDIIAIVRQAMRKRSADRFKDAETLRIAIARVRRQYESDDDFNRPTRPVGFDTTTLSGANRGTGSARRRSNGAVGVAQMTPPPDPRRTDREVLARRRTTQVEAAITLARTLLGQRKLEDALDACQQALTLDETHAGALELEEDIQTALRIREGVEMAADDSIDSALTTAAEPSSLPGLMASRLLDSQAVTRAHEQAFVVTGLPPASAERPLTAPVPTASVAPVAVSAPTATLPAPTVTAPAVPQAAPGARNRLVPAPMKWVVAGIAAVAVVAVAAVLLTGGPAPTGTAVIDAAPWANITEIRNEDGELQPLPTPALTPLSLALPAGTYQISFSGPPPQSKKETVTLRVNAAQTSVAPVTRFQSLTVEEYFDEYLGGAR